MNPVHPHACIFRPWTVRCLIASVLFLNAAQSNAAEPQVPAGFSIQRVDGDGLVQRPVFGCFDNQGNLFVGESNGENLTRVEMLAKKPHWISRLEDTDGDGIFDKTTKFVENITLPQGCMWYRGSLYAACPPSIWKFTDTDQDGVADKREEILTGFGFSGNACDTHGPFLSPSGRIYIVQGRHGHTFHDPDGKVFSKGTAGRIYSCMPDGKDVRIHAGGGFDNPVEVDFTDEGECIGTANIVFRDRGDCLLHWVEGGVYPREDQADAIAEFKWTGGLLGPIYDVGHVAISGVTRYRGQQLGPEFTNRWFFTEFNTRRVKYAVLQRQGSTFSAEIHDFMHYDDGDFHPTDILEDVDGSLLVLNTGGWFRNGCPTSRISRPEAFGSIYRIRKAGNAPEVLVDRKKLMADVQGVRDLQGIIDHLQNPHPEVHEQTVQLVRAHADLGALVQAELRKPLFVKQGEQVVVNPELPAPRVYAGLLRTTSEADDACAIVTRLFNNWPVDWNGLSAEQQEGAAQIAQVTLMHARDLVWQKPMSAKESAGLVTSSAQAPPAVFRSAMEFFATRCLDRQTPVLDVEEQQVYDFLEAAAQQPMDQVARHCFIYALLRWNHEPALQTILLESSTAAAQEAALIALDQMDNAVLQPQSVVALLSKPDPAVQKSALTVISRHPGWGPWTLAVLKQWLAEPELPEERAVAVSSFLQVQLSDPAVQEWVKQVLLSSTSSLSVQRAFWDALQKTNLAVWPEAFTSILQHGLQSADPEIQLAALRVIAQRSPKGVETELNRLADDPQSTLAVRCESLSILGTAGQTIQEATCEFLLQQLDDANVSSNDKALIGRALGASLLVPKQLVKLASRIDSAGPLVVPVLIKAFSRSQEESVGQAFVEALRKTDSLVSISPDELASILRKYPEGVRESAAPLFKQLGVDPAAQAARLAELSELLHGGDAGAGRVIFFGKKASCSACHAIGPEGGHIGPHLTTIGASRAPQDLLEAIVFPSASFVNGYRPTMVVTDDGRILQGVISSETSHSITLKTRELQEIHVRRDEIDEQREASASIMPAGLDRQLTPQEFRDLLAFLQSRK